MAGPSMDDARDGVGHNGTEFVSEVEAPAGSTAKGAPPLNTEAVNSVLYSEIGISILLNRLKQSIASARDFSGFLTKRARLEDEHAQGLKKLSRATLESVRRQDGRQGTYSTQFANVCGAQDRMADHGVQFANSLHQMHTDVDELIARIERDRKHWKTEGLNSEKKVKDAESALEKAKARYDSLAEDYDRVKTGGSTSGRVFTVKGPKSAEKHEEDLNRKVQAADAEYQSKVQTARTTRQDNTSTWRPQAVKAIQELILESDSALTLQLQKFAAFNEKLLVGNGLEVSPVKPEGDPSRALSMREMIAGIDNSRDFHTYVSSHSNNVPAAPADIAYQKHPTLGGSHQAPPIQTSTPTTNKRSSFQQSPQMATQSPSSAFGSSTTQAPPSFSAASQPQQSPLSQAPPRQQTQSPSSATPISSLPYHTSSPSSSGPPPPSYQQGPPPQAQDRSFRGPPQQSQYQQSGPPNGNYPSSEQNYQDNSLRERPTQAHRPGYSQTGPNGNYASQSQQPPPTKPIFGQSLDLLFRRDDTAVPYVVYQCIQAVDLFGLQIEGIYRMSGNAAHIQQLKSIFDNSPQPPDFRDPASFHHDVNSAASLLKTFFRELPEPLFTRTHYTSFIDAARLDDDNARRDGVHAVINDLPDPNYATLRVLMLHLGRVQEMSGVNRMGGNNLAICFAPTLMGQHLGNQMADQGLQARVVDTILRNVTAIFDED